MYNCSLFLFVFLERPFDVLLGEHKGNIQPLMPYEGYCFLIELVLRLPELPK